MTVKKITPTQMYSDIWPTNGIAMIMLYHANNDYAARHCSKARLLRAWVMVNHEVNSGK